MILSAPRIPFTDLFKQLQSSSGICFSNYN
jgi:hypothetical protein